MNTFNRLLRILRCVGWGTGTRDPSIIAFVRNENGWRVGGGTIVTPWAGKEVPTDRMQALYEIELFYNEMHREATGQPLVPDLELLSRAADFPE